MDALTTQETKKTRVKEIAKLLCYIIFAVLFILLFINALYSALNRKHVTTIFGYRCVAIVSDSMEREIMTGDLIFSKKLNDSYEIKVGDVITYYVTLTKGTFIITHRVAEIRQIDGQPAYVTKGDNALGFDNYFVAREDILGVYTGRRIPMVGYLGGFLTSYQGIITLGIIFLIICATMYVNGAFDEQDKMELAKQQALKKSLLFVDTIGKHFGYSEEMEELTEIIDIVISKDKKKKEPEKKRLEFERIDEFNKLEYEVLGEETKLLLERPIAAHKKAFLLNEGGGKGANSKLLQLNSPTDNAAQKPPKMPKPPKPPARIRAEAQADLKRLRELNELLKKDLTPLTLAEQRELRKMQKEQNRIAKQEMLARKESQTDITAENEPKVVSLSAATSESPKPKKIRAEIDPEQARLRKEKREANKALREQREREYFESLSETERELYALAKQRREEEKLAISRLKRIAKQRLAYENLRAEQKDE